MEETKTNNLAAQASRTLFCPTDHKNHCFVVMPFGREPAERELFKGWYDAVIRPAVSGDGICSDSLVQRRAAESNQW